VFPTNIKVQAGESVKIFCKSEKHVMWEFQDGPLIGTIYKSNITEKDSSGYFVHWILIFEVDLEYSGEYTCNSVINSRLVVFKSKLVVYGEFDKDM